MIIDVHLLHLASWTSSTHTDITLCVTLHTEVSLFQRLTCPLIEGGVSLLQYITCNL